MGIQPRAALVLAMALKSSLPSTVSGGASCCKSKNVPEVVDPYAHEPEWWDEEDDGPWEAGLVTVSSVKDFDWKTMRIKGWWRWSHEFPLLAADNSGWLLAGLLVAGQFPPPTTAAAAAAAATTAAITAATTAATTTRRWQSVHAQA